MSEAGTVRADRVATAVAEHSPIIGALGRILFSIMAVVGVFAFIYASSEMEMLRGNALDSGEWGISTHTITKNVRIVWAILMSIVIGILMNSFFYFAELMQVRSTYERVLRKRSHWLTVCFMINVGAIFLCLVWLLLLYSSATMDLWSGSELVPNPSEVIDTLARSSWLSLFVFVIFTVEDTILYYIAKHALTYEALDPSTRREIKAAESYALESILFIDLPVILGSGLLFVFGLLEQNAKFIAGGLTESAHVFYMNADLARDPEFLENRDLLQAALNAPVKIGFAGGIHITQLFLSQLIFCILTLKSALSTDGRSFWKWCLDAGEALRAKFGMAPVSQRGIGSKAANAGCEPVKIDHERK